jgi:hypothetical protein
LTLSELTDPGAVLQAVAESDRLGRDRFLSTHGFHRARDYLLIVNGHEYDSKAIVGVAHGYQFPSRGPLKSNQFSGGLATVKRKLDQLGFEVRVPSIPEIEAEGTYWWRGSSTERFWIEIRRVREGLGQELRCPFEDTNGNRNGWWDLLDEVRPGDCIYHWNADQGRFVGRSIAATARKVDGQTGERVVPLRDFLPLTVDIGLEQIRALTQELEAVRDALAQQYSAATLYLPFQFRHDGLRLMSNYFTKLPLAMRQELFGADGLGESDLPDPPQADGPPVRADEERHGRPGGFLRPFKPRADTDYITQVSGGAFRRGRTHETLVNDFAEWLAAKGLLAASNAAIDLGLEHPPVIIEAKVIRPGRWAAAIREAIGQLYEYRYFQVVAPQSRLLFLASTDIPRKWLDYLDKDRQIGAAWRISQGEFLFTDRARKMLGVSP